MKSRIMLIEYLGDGPAAPPRIGRVHVAPAGGTLYYRGHSFQPLKGAKSKANFTHTKTGEPYRFCACSIAKGIVEIDDDVREEYWTVIRHEPKRAKERSFGPAP